MRALCGSLRPRGWEAPPESLPQRGALRTSDAQSVHGRRSFWWGLQERKPRGRDSVDKKLPGLLVLDLEVGGLLKR